MLAFDLVLLEDADGFFFGIACYDEAVERGFHFVQTAFAVSAGAGIGDLRLEALERVAIDKVVVADGGGAFPGLDRVTALEDF